MPEAFAAAAVGVHAGGEHFGDHADRRAGALHPAHEHRMDVACGVGSDVALEIGEHVGKGAALPRQRPVEAGFRRLGRRRPDGPAAQIAQEVDHPVERAMALGAEGVPVVGVEVDRLGHVAALGRHGGAKAVNTGMRRASPGGFNGSANSRLWPWRATVVSGRASRGPNRRRRSRPPPGRPARARPRPRGCR